MTADMKIEGPNYIGLIPESERVLGCVDSTEELAPNVNLDYDSNGRLIGIEILGTIWLEVTEPR